MMNTIAMATALRALSRSCLPALGPTHSTRSARLGHGVGAELGGGAR
jgi:hypothetical protein